jgi:hypothetical protein
LFCVDIISSSSQSLFVQAGIFGNISAFQVILRTGGHYCQMIQLKIPAMDVNSSNLKPCRGPLEMVYISLLPSLNPPFIILFMPVPVTKQYLLASFKILSSTNSSIHY